ncbi:hypothetical protein PR048_002606 [Dryococelus australis]|uniref:Uncharacterized protein n=1 Tax=Dryococelus australis TaxID=614101 RepID=A0ABQ9IKL6_9NEOP|nr:hypothetical protein PR048_002606 [Dryococelus australis]
MIRNYPLPLPQDDISRAELGKNRDGGKQLIMADALSRRPCSTDKNWECTEEILSYVYTVVSNLPTTDTKLQEIAVRSQRKDNLRHLIRYCTEGWPDKSQLTEELIPYWQHHSDISLHNGLLRIGTFIIIPSCMRIEIHKKLHDGHQE